MDGNFLKSLVLRKWKENANYLIIQVVTSVLCDSTWKKPKLQFRMETEVQIHGMLIITCHRWHSKIAKLEEDPTFHKVFKF